MKRAFIIYGSASNIARRVIVAESSSININSHLAPGEDWTTDDINPDTQFIDIADVMFRTKGIVRASDRCAVISSNGDVTRFIAADPIIDGLPGFSLVKSSNDNVREGWRWTSSGGFSPPSTSAASTGGGSSNGGFKPV